MESKRRGDTYHFTLIGERRTLNMEVESKGEVEMWLAAITQAVSSATKQMVVERDGKASLQHLPVRRFSILVRAFFL